MSGPSGEEKLLDIIRRATVARGRVRLGIGDDACIVANGTVLTTDAYVEDVHFDLAYLSLGEVGLRCALAALSDVVAMAARPEAVLVALGLPARLASPDVRRLYRGIEHACALLGCEVAGGDIVRADRLMLAITATGRTRTPKLRSAARPGERLYVTGHIAASETGRLALARGLPRRRFAPAIARHRCPVPRLETMLRLRSRIGALTDTSDGLATDARHVAAASDVRVTIDRSALPVLAATRRLFGTRDRYLTRFLLSSGEDHELLFTSARPVPARVAGVPVAAIGVVEPGSGLFLRSGDAVRPVLESGYDHLDRVGKSC
jgi:thiamine-monophosphate kinase